MLLVDSDKDYRENCDSFEKRISMKFQVLWASNIQEATVTIRNHRPSVNAVLLKKQKMALLLSLFIRKGGITDNQIDVLIVDLMMPNIDLFWSFSTIRKRTLGKNISLLV